MLWRVSFMFDGRQMESIMTILAEQKGIYNVEGPMPAIKVDDRSPSAVLVEKLAGRRKVTRQEIKAWVEELGRPGTGFAYYVKKLVTEGAIRPSSARGTYDVVGAAKSGAKKKRL